MTTPVPPPGPHGGDAARVAAWLGRPVTDAARPVGQPEPGGPGRRRRHRRAPRPRPAATRTPPPPPPRWPRAIGVDPDLLVLTNGGAEAIALVAAIEQEGAIVEPEFSLYRRHLERVTPDAPRWRSNPSNPIGLLAPPDATARVWDEAFYPLAAGAWTRGDAGSWRIGSLTKVWGCPGLRIGYVIAPDAAAAAACGPASRAGRSTGSRSPSSRR